MLSLLLKLLLIITLFNFFHHLSAQKCNPDDEAGLLAFKSGIKSDPSGMLQSWIPGTGCCDTWLGISCTQPNRVTDIILYGDYHLNPKNSTLNLYGTISPGLSKIPYLKSIYLMNIRNISGLFPTFLFKLPRLQSFFFVNTTLSGKLPENIGTSFSTTSRLVSFSLEGNLFSGTIPTSIGQLSHLKELYLSRNMFTGSIPYSISSLNTLNSLSLDRNQLTGTIPDFFKTLSNLRILDASHNKLSGNIPGSIVSIFSKLDGYNVLDLSWNQLQGIVPNSFANLTQSDNIDLSHNSLIGPFPQLKVLGTIRSIDLSYNQFRFGQIPSWVATTGIVSLKLAKCGIDIKLDDWKPVNINSFEYIDLSENNITGSPVQILNRSPNDSLVRFYASGNRLKFNLESLNIAPTLKYLDLSRNLVFGKVPKAVSGLDFLNVSNNHLCGQLPKTNFSASAFVGNDCLCGSPLPKCKA